MLRRFFKLDQLGTDVRRESAAGVTTFLTMAYIIFVNPDIFSGTGMDKGALITTTVLASVFGTLLAGLWGAIFSFMFVDLFDSVGTIVACSYEAGLVAEDGTIHGIDRVLEADAVATVAGALLGTSTTTCYIESGGNPSRHVGYRRALRPGSYPRCRLTSFPHSRHAVR
jgi:xanthine/uracil/vitamin C permease (AzgA family)